MHLLDEAADEVERGFRFQRRGIAAIDEHQRLGRLPSNAVGLEVVWCDAGVARSTDKQTGTPVAGEAAVAVEVHHLRATGAQQPQDVFTRFANFQLPAASA